MRDEDSKVNRLARHRVVRLFAAIYPPQVAARDMLARLDDIVLPRHRPTPAEQVHMTLVFIGDTAVRDLDHVVESLWHAAAGTPCFSLQCTRLCTLPERGRPRLVAMQTEAPAALLDLKYRLAQRLAHRPRAGGGERFWPHFTLCRFAHDADAQSISREVALPAVPIGEVRLMRSHLNPAGARHELVAAAPLRPAARPSGQ